MDRVMEFRVGVVVLASMIITGVLILLFGDLPTMKGTYEFEVKLPYARGVAQGTPVRKSGILIGRVQNVRFDDDGGVILTLQVEEDVRLTHSDVCQLRTTLLGDAELEFIPRAMLKYGVPGGGSMRSQATARSAI